MPCLQVRTNLSLTAEQKEAALQALTQIINKRTGKPTMYIMVMIQDNVSMAFGGDSKTPCVFMDFRSIGCISRSENKKTSADLTKYWQTLGVSPEKVYISFANAAGENWGFAGDTFA